MKYVAVDDIRVYRFLEEVMALPFNNPIAPFETSEDITSYLQEQWAGLFHRLLQESTRQKETMLIEDLQSSLKTVNQLVTFLTDERKEGDRAIHEILTSNHPVFDALKKLLRVQYRIFFLTLEEMNSWLSARSYKRVPEEQWDDAKTMEWWHEDSRQLLKVSSEVFDEDGKLIVRTVQQWKKDFVSLTKLPPKEVAAPVSDDNVPF